ncbi:RdgB/HAM1 family non-canonical purine NTP pyrophosphatase [Ostreibacterium oceani]|uniref:dITP/XTP pyrophosphatase n=1 Tax=Ostreibacterium oceani TaxID=2654998 RepID=A0A6N7EV83_9GAMM|nr:RdgB/HAM1 family non-canonical purine NTP pyrophosphatase [Ostreibacterium oceani]MPV86471.1 RdgB/HAM1 family non-canonical purine NTP pyrophosphatase [Ostreibacterium oceani]
MQTTHTSQATQAAQVTQASFNQLVLASDNAGKLHELTALLSPLSIQVIAQADLGVAAAEETGTTFIENALIKAKHASALTGLPALADDSGLVVDALHGAPGVHSARYAGEPKSDSQNNEKLLQAMQHQSNRRAQFVCVLALCWHHEHPLPLIASGQWQGEILTAPSGHHGFGYDPLFYLPALKRSAATLTTAEKNQYSHRAIALTQLITQLNQMPLNQAQLNQTQSIAGGQGTNDEKISPLGISND